MTIPCRWFVAGLAAVAMSACNDAPPDVPVPITEPMRSEPAPVTGTAPDTSVPIASSVFLPAADIRPDPAAARTTRPMTQAQESGAMPMPGQNNDHSAPALPAASAPQRRAGS